LERTVTGVEGLLEVGRIVRAHGLRGQVVVALLTNRTERVDPGSVLYTEARSLEVVTSAVQGHDRWLVKFAGVDDRDAAESLGHPVLRATPLPADGTLWVHELVGSEVFEADGTRRGIVTDLQANPASDLLVLDSGALIPLRFVVECRDGRVRIDAPPGLFDL
jgi:16S rRNA processing protein RimM